MAQAPKTPNVEAQRAAMKRLQFLVGEWAGEASALRGLGQFVDLVQTESPQFKLDGLVLVIEGVGRAKADGKPALQALGLISFDDDAGTYRMRAFNDGRWLETEVKLADGENSISWGFALGEFKTTTVLRINDEGEWTELGQLIMPRQRNLWVIDTSRSGGSSGRTLLAGHISHSDVFRFGWSLNASHSSFGTPEAYDIHTSTSGNCVPCR